jgi:hypothetical protein
MNGMRIADVLLDSTRSKARTNSGSTRQVLRNSPGMQEKRSCFTAARKLAEVRAFVPAVVIRCDLYRAVRLQ